MKSIDFPECNVALAKDQSQYRTLYASLIQGEEGQMIVEFELTDEEIAQIIKTKRLYYSQFTFGNLFQPMKIMTESPFNEQIKAEGPPMDENRVTAIQWDETHYVNSWITGTQGYGPCVNCCKLIIDHFYSTHQCKL